MATELLPGVGAGPLGIGAAGAGRRQLRLRLQQVRLGEKAAVPPLAERLEGQLGRLLRGPRRLQLGRSALGQVIEGAGAQHRRLPGAER